MIIKRKKDYGDDFFVGTWELEGIYWVARPGRRWPRWIPLGSNDSAYTVWTFTENAEHSACSNGEHLYSTYYYYRKDYRNIFIDLHFLREKDPVFSCIGLYCRVDIRNKDHVRLYVLNNVSSEPQDYWLAYRLFRI